MEKLRPYLPLVLVVEDEDFNYLLLEEFLAPLPIALVHATDGRKALDVCRKMPSIAMVLMDIKTPNMDGHSAALEIRKLRPHLPIVAQTAYALHDERSRYEADFDDYLTKPINEDVLLQTMKKFLRF